MNNKHNFISRAIYFILPVLAFMCLFSNILTAQITYLCDYRGTGDITVSDFEDLETSPVISNEINRITDVIGIKKNFLTYICPGTDNCSAFFWLLDDGKPPCRILVIDPSFIAKGQKDSNPFFMTLVLAHEIGHHFYGHSLEVGSGPSRELEADEFAGFVLHKLGATRKQAMDACLVMGYTNITTTHLAKNYRIDAVAKGWDKSAGSSSSGDRNNSNSHTGNTSTSRGSVYTRVIESDISEFARFRENTHLKGDVSGTLAIEDGLQVLIDGDVSGVIRVGRGSKLLIRGDVSGRIFVGHGSKVDVQGDTSGGIDYE